MDTLKITEEAWNNLVKAASKGNWLDTRVTALNEDHIVVTHIVPGKLHWIVTDNPYSETIVAILADNRIVNVEQGE
jgi:hypothetical protein